RFTGQRQIGGMIAVEIPHGYRLRKSSRRVNLRSLEGTVAIAQEDTPRSPARCSPVDGKYEVGNAVAIDIRHRHRVSPPANLVVVCGVEGAIAVAQENTDSARVPVGDGEIENAVAI